MNLSPMPFYSKKKKSGGNNVRKCANSSDAAATLLHRDAFKDQVTHIYLYRTMGQDLPAPFWGNTVVENRLRISYWPIT